MDDPQQPPILKSHEGGRQAYTGLELMGDVFDLMRRSLPNLPEDDPHRPVVSAFLAELGPTLGRDRLVAVPASRQSPPG